MTIEWRFIRFRIIPFVITHQMVAVIITIVKAEKVLVTHFVVNIACE